MAIQKAVCTRCGGNLKVDDIDLNGFCECLFCRTKYKVIDVITVDGLPTVKTLLTNAEFNIQDNKLEEAVKLYKEVIKIKPNCHEAWWGLYICNDAFDRYYNYEDKYGNKGPMITANIMENTLNSYAKRAIDFAPPKEAEEYKSKIQPTLDYIDNLRNPKKTNSITANKLSRLLKSLFNKK